MESQNAITKNNQKRRDRRRQGKKDEQKINAQPKDSVEKNCSKCETAPNIHLRKKTYNNKRNSEIQSADPISNNTEQKVQQGRSNVRYSKNQAAQFQVDTKTTGIKGVEFQKSASESNKKRYKRRTYSTRSTENPDAKANKEALKSPHSFPGTKAACKKRPFKHFKKKKKYPPSPFKKNVSLLNPHYSDSKFLQSFENITLLGRGGYGKVFKAKPKSGKSFFAVKVVELPSDKKEREKVCLESQALEHLNHPNILKLFETWTEDITAEFLLDMESSDEESFTGEDTHSFLSVQSQKTLSRMFMMMELCDATLTEWLEQNLKRTRFHYYEIFRQICKALDHIHKSKLIHRDIKPSNIFMQNNLVKVGDFGLVKALHCSSFEKFLSTEFFGTSKLDLYMAPELKLGKKYKPTVKVDIFPLGLILLEMIIRCETAHERCLLLRNARNDIFPPTFAEDYPQQSKFIRSMLSFDPLLRPSADELFNNKLTIAAQKRRKKNKKVLEGRQKNGSAFGATCTLQKTGNKN